MALAQLSARLSAAAVGGYVLAHLLPLAVVALLPISRVDAVLAAAQASFAVYAVVIIWSFAARSAARAWMGLLLTALASLLVLAVQGGMA